MGETVEMSFALDIDWCLPLDGRMKKEGGTSMEGDCRGGQTPFVTITLSLAARATTKLGRTTQPRLTLTTRRSLYARTSSNGSSFCAPSVLMGSALISSRVTVRLTQKPSMSLLADAYLLCLSLMHKLPPQRSPHPMAWYVMLSC